MNIIHKKFIETCPTLNLKDLYKVLDNITDEKRYKMLSWAYYAMMSSIDWDKVDNGSAKISESFKIKHNYDNLKSQIQKAINLGISKLFIVNSLINYTLSNAYAITGINRKKNEVYFQRALVAAELAGDFNSKNMIEKHISEIDSRIERNIDNYNWICDNIILPLLEIEKRKNKLR